MPSAATPDCEPDNGLTLSIMTTSDQGKMRYGKSRTATRGADCSFCQLDPVWTNASSTVAPNHSRTSQPPARIRRSCARIAVNGMIADVSFEMEALESMSLVLLQ